MPDRESALPSQVTMRRTSEYAEITTIFDCIVKDTITIPVHGYSNPGHTLGTGCKSASGQSEAQLHSLDRLHLTIRHLPLESQTDLWLLANGGRQR